MCDEQINEAQRGSWHRYSLRKTEMVSSPVCGYGIEGEMGR